MLQILILMLQILYLDVAMKHTRIFIMMQCTR
jgi:hypothetical protein